MVNLYETTGLRNMTNSLHWEHSDIWFLLYRYAIVPRIFRHWYYLLFVILAQVHVLFTIFSFKDNFLSSSSCVPDHVSHAYIILPIPPPKKKQVQYSFSFLVLENSKKKGLFITKYARFAALTLSCILFVRVTVCCLYIILYRRVLNKDVYNKMK